MTMLSLVASLVAIAVAALAYYLFVYDDFRPESVAGKRVLVTGASSGIGEEIAYFYAKFGASLVIVARRGDLLEKVAETCKKLGARKVDLVVADLAVPQQRIDVVRAAKKSLGGLDHLILDHALMSSYLWRGSAENMTMLRYQVDVNFLSYVHLASLSLDMLKESEGNIGIVSSLAGRLSFFMSNSYSASKFALDGFFVGYREELKLTRTGISVSVAYLGYTATEAARTILEGLFQEDAHQLPRPASVSECAAAIVRGVATRKREIVFPRRFHILFFVHSIAPNFVVTLLSSWLNRPTVRPN